MAALTSHLFPWEDTVPVRWNKQTHKMPLIHWTLKPLDKFEESPVEIGVRREGRAGTDALGLHMSPVVVNYLKRKTSPKFVMGEGDRLANSNFFKAAIARGHTLFLFHLYAGEKVVSERREARGSKQDIGWLRSRRTKTYKLADEWGGVVVHLNAELAVEELRRKVVATPGIHSVLNPA